MNIPLPPIPKNTTIPMATIVDDNCVDCGEQIDIGKRYRSQRFGKPLGKAKQRSHIECRPNDEVSAWVNKLGVEEASEAFSTANR